MIAMVEVAELAKAVRGGSCTAWEEFYLGCKQPLLFMTNTVL